MTETLKKLITLLSDGQFHSGEQLGKALGLTRSAVWKLMKQLASWDITIESIPNKGYCLAGGLNLLDQEKIASFLSTPARTILDKIEIFDSIPSTNDYLLHCARNQTKETRVCLAEKQTHGRGRQGRSWYSPFAKNLHVSLLWHFSKDLSELSGLSLVMGIAIVETLNELKISHEFKIKWPNDILCKNRKLAGILIELIGEAHHTTSVVIGIGLNINMPTHESVPIDQPWIDLQQLSPRPLDRNEIISKLLNNIVEIMTLFEKQGLAAFTTQWQTLDATQGKPVVVTTATTSVAGVGTGIDSKGNFLLKTNSGEVQHFASGEVSIRLKSSCEMPNRCLV